MSYDIYLEDAVGVSLEMPEPHFEGGTRPLGGTRECWLNVTYNYSKFYYDLFPPAHGDERGIRTIYGMTGAESIPILEGVIAKLGDDVSSNYWEPTEGNAKKALLTRREFARAHPTGIWQGD